MSLYEMPLPMPVLVLGDGEDVSQRLYGGVKSSFQHVREEGEFKRPMCFGYLMFSLSGPCELLFLHCYIASWTWVMVSVMLYPCILCVARLMDLFVLCLACLTIFVNYFTKQFAICLGVVVILLLDVMALFNMVGCALLCIPCMVFQRVCCVCNLSVRLDAPSICFVCIFVCRKLSPRLRVWELDHRCLLSLCCFFMWVCTLCDRIRACSCYACHPLVCCACLPSLWCL